MLEGLGDPGASDPAEQFSARPNFQGLVYPHMLDVFPTADSPPVFLIASQDDGAGGEPEARPDFTPQHLGGPVGDAIARLYLDFRAAGAAAELCACTRAVGLHPRIRAVTVRLVRP